jgi:hypothetical protein
MSNSIDYARGDATPILQRWLAYLIAAKVLLVLLNTALAFADGPAVLRLVGVGLQIALTILFLVLLLRMMTRTR